MLHEDRTGTLWVGTRSGGLNALDRETGRVRRYRADPEDPRAISSDNVTDILEDRRGRLWIAENYTYAERALKFDLKLRDRVLIFEDANGNGRFSSRRVFADEFQRLTSIEVGLGGRLDATNVAEPAISIITPISYDHTHLLGRTLGAIATEKAGIIRPNGVVISGPQRPAALTAIRATVRRQRAHLTVIGSSSAAPRLVWSEARRLRAGDSITAPFFHFGAASARGNYRDLTLHLGGAHQDRGVRVVATRVHHPDLLAVVCRAHLRRERHIHFFSHGKGVHVGPQRNDGTRFPAAEHPDDREDEDPEQHEQPEPEHGEGELAHHRAVTADRRGR